MSVAVWTAIGGIITLLGVILKWWKNPKRILEAKIDALERDWAALQFQIDEPLAKHDTDKLTRLNHELLCVSSKLKTAKDELARLNGTTVIKIMAIFFVIGLCGCVAKTVYFNDSEKVICDFAGQGVCSGTNYDCCLLSAGDWKSSVSNNPTVKIIKVQDNTEVKGGE